MPGCTSVTTAFSTSYQGDAGWSESLDWIRNGPLVPWKRISIAPAAGLLNVVIQGGGSVPKADRLHKTAIARTAETARTMLRVFIFMSDLSSDSSFEC